MTEIRHDFTVEAEQQLLGSILVENRRFDLVADFLKPDHFLDPVHKRIFEICQRRILNGHIASPVVVASVMDGDMGLSQLGGGTYLIRMAGASISGSQVRQYAAMVVEAAARRALTYACQETLSSVLGGGDTQESKIALLGRLQSLPEVHGEASTYSLLATATEAVENAVKSYQGQTSFLKTGVPALDKVLRGMAPGDVCLIGGATSMGKTSLALEIARNVAVDQGKPVAFVSLEMTRQELVTRMMASHSRVPYSSLRDASAMEEDDFRKWVEAAPSIGAGNMRIIPKHIRDIAAIHAAARRAKQEMGGLALVVVDYAQLVRGTGKGRYEQMTEVSIGLKTMAGMLECPVIPLVQLSRDIGHRDDKRPQLSDIKETGQFENDADQVVFCHREAYWMERQGPKPNAKGEITDQARIEWQADLEACRNVMELIVRKNRHGGLARCEVGFHAPTNRFWELGRQQPEFEI